MIRILEIITNTTSVKADVSESVVAFGAVACIPGLFFFLRSPRNQSFSGWMLLVQFPSTILVIFPSLTRTSLSLRMKSSIVPVFSALLSPHYNSDSMEFHQFHAQRYLYYWYTVVNILPVLAPYLRCLLTKNTNKPYNLQHVPYSWNASVSIWRANEQMQSTMNINYFTLYAAAVAWETSLRISHSNDK